MEQKHSSDSMENVAFQEEISNSTGKRILMAGRQSGKSETVLIEANTKMQDGKDVLVIAPTHRLKSDLADRYREKYEWGEATRNTVTLPLSDEYPDSCVDFASSYDLRQSEYSLDFDVDVVLVDEANYVPADLLFKLEAGDLVGPTQDVLLTATPHPDRSIVSIWAEYSPYWTEYHVPSTESPITNDEHIEKMRGALSQRNFKYEIRADYKLNE